MRFMHNMEKLKRQNNQVENKFTGKRYTSYLYMAGHIEQTFMD